VLKNRSASFQLACPIPQAGSLRYSYSPHSPASRTCPVPQYSGRCRPKPSILVYKKRDGFLLHGRYEM